MVIGPITLHSLRDASSGPRGEGAMLGGGPAPQPPSSIVGELLECILQLGGHHSSCIRHITLLAAPATCGARPSRLSIDTFHKMALQVPRTTP